MLNVKAMHELLKDHTQRVLINVYTKDLRKLIDASVYKTESDQNYFVMQIEDAFYALITADLQSDHEDYQTSEIIFCYECADLDDAKQTVLDQLRIDLSDQPAI